MCGSRKCPYSPHKKGLEIPAGGGISKAENFKEMYEA